MKKYFLAALLISSAALATSSSTRTIVANIIKSGSGLLTLPSSTDTLVGRATTDTLTNKTVDGGANTLTNINATNLTSGTLVIAQGGTNNGSLAVTAGGVLYTDGSKLANIGVGVSGQIFTSQGSSAPIWSSAQANLPETVQRLTSGSAATYGLSYVFTTSSANATVGATYTNNGHTYTVSGTIAAATSLTVTSNGTPAASGTLTKSGGTGDSTITFSSYRAPIYIEVMLVGGGGGGGGSASIAGNNGGTSSGASATTFANTVSLSAGAGGGGTGTQNSAVGAGGSNSVSGGGTVLANVTGGAGGPGLFGGTGLSAGGANGGVSFFGGAGAGGLGGAAAGSAAVANSGSGGGGSGCPSGGITGTGGGAGGFLHVLIASPESTYTYTVGAAGSAGAAGTAGGLGGAGSTGVIVVKEHF